MSRPPAVPVLQELVIPALALGFCAYFFWTVQDLSWEAKANGLVVGTVLLALIAAFVARIALRVGRGEARLGFAMPGGEGGHHRTRVAMLALCVAFVAVLPWLGTTISLALLLLSLMWLLGACDRRAMAAVAIGGPLTVYLLMMLALGTRLPEGPFEQFIGLLFGVGGDG